MTTPQHSTEASIADGPSGARQALLAAARAELMEHGNAAVGLRAIARRAGVSHAAPKYFFDDRAGLLTAVAAAGFQELTQRLRSARLGHDEVHSSRAVAGSADARSHPDPDPDADADADADAEKRPDPGEAATDDGRLRAAGRIYFDFGIDQPALFDLMFRSADLHPDDPDLQQAKAEALAELTAVVGGSDATDATDATELTLVNWAFAHGLVVLAREQALGSSSQDVDPRELAYRLFDVFGSGARRG